MATETIKDYTNGLAIAGLLLFSLVAFAGIFYSYNNPIGLGSDGEFIFNQTKGNISTGITAMEGDSNDILSVAALTDPTASALGSKDSVSTSFSIFGAGKTFFSSTKLLIAWIFAGEVGKMLLSIFVGILGITGVYLIYRAIRGY
jgi:hypothetical protein